MVPDFETCLNATRSRDPRFDGWFFVAVSSTGIYCRPSCPAASPKREHMHFYPTAAAAQAAGYRACLRCRPDATPGSPQWDLRADVAGRAMRLIADGIVDREGVDGLARRLAYSPRQLRRVLLDQLGAGPVALARAQRAQTARILIETTDLPFIDVAFAAGFGSLRQFNETVQAIYARPPRELRRKAAVRPEAGRLGTVTLRLPCRPPLHASGLLEFLRLRAIPGVEEVADGTYRRTLRLPHGAAAAELSPQSSHVRCTLRLSDLRDLAAGVSRCRGMFDLDADPIAVSERLDADPIIAPLVRAAPGRRVPGAADGGELALRAVVGQQVSVGAARTVLGRLAEEHGEPLAQPIGSLHRLFPSYDAIAALDPASLPMPRRRALTLIELAKALAERRVVLDPGADREESERRLLELHGIGPWTVSYVRMRALGDTDAFPAADHGVLSGLRALGGPATARGATEHAAAWRPWRAYAVQYLWADPASGRPTGR